MAARPVHEIRRGLILVRIWRKRARGRTRYSTSVVRLFRNGTVWIESTRFDAGDIPVIRLALDDAYGWLLGHADKEDVRESSTSQTQVKS